MQEFSNHQVCQTLTELTLEHLPRDGTLGDVRTYHKGVGIWRPEDAADRIYFLKRGQAAVTASDAEGREVLIRLVEPGEPFGELCFCSEKEGIRRTTARAVNDCEAVEIKHRDFTNYLQSDTNALNSFVFTFCRRLSDAERRIEILAHRGAEDRLGRLLLHLAAIRGQSDDRERDKMMLRVNHDELAQMAAMSRSHVTVTMGKFRQRGFVLYERNRPLVVDVPSLKDYLNRAQRK